VLASSSGKPPPGRAQAGPKSLSYRKLSYKKKRKKPNPYHTREIGHQINFFYFSFFIYFS
jgi:hypothetical protein